LTGDKGDDEHELTQSAELNESSELSRAYEHNESPEHTRAYEHTESSEHNQNQPPEGGALGDA
jgi:hypothetical protein